MSDELSFEGLLLEVPFGRRNTQSGVREQYRDLLDRHDPDDVFVLTGSPTSMDTFTELLADECPGAVVPTVSSSVVHATNVVNRSDDRTVLSDRLRRELVHRFIADWEWETEYFRRASGQQSFRTDVAQLIETGTWQDVSFEATPELVELGELRDAFHEWLAEHGHVERPQLIREATEILSDPAKRESVLDFDAVLVVEFEEFVPSDRRYLQELSTNRELVCVAERDSSVRRTSQETGRIMEYVSFTEQRELDASPPNDRQSATASYFARGEVPADPETGDVRVLTAQTADDEVDRVADEIERLAGQGETKYEDIAVAVKWSGEDVIDVVEAFETAGIPTASTAIVGFGDDPAVREFLCAVHELAGDDEYAAELSFDADVLDDDSWNELREVSHLGTALRRWATESNLKLRIADGSDPLDARSQFSNVRRVFALADFLEETAFLDATWENLAAMLARSLEFAAQVGQTSAIDGDGVRVDRVEALKNGSFDVVFLLDLTDETYPGEPSLSRLFPRRRVLEMDAFPGVTAADDATVARTFATDSTSSSRPVRRYYAEHARRELGVGAAVADERLYFCLHTHEATALDERVQPSRFLTDAFTSLPWLTDVAESEITSERAAEEYVLARIDRALGAVRRANSQDVSVSIDEFEAEFAEIQTLLDASGERGAELRDAMEARRDFAAGRVLRE